MLDWLEVFRVDANCICSFMQCQKNTHDDQYLRIDPARSCLTKVISNKESIVTFQEFIALITKEQPALDDISQIITFAESADVEVIWEALQASGIHAIIVALLVNMLQHKIQAARNTLHMPPSAENMPQKIAGNPV
jgi:hypothetical protein